ncbi:MAG TPA: DUF4231 domain-containing protein [Actinomycetes bacterium]
MARTRRRPGPGRHGRYGAAPRPPPGAHSRRLQTGEGAALPVVAGIGSPVWVTGGLAAVIVVLEGVQHLYQFQEHWITYRSTAEALKHERYLYLAKAGPYAGEDRHRQLAERLEGLISQEHAKWTASHREVSTRSEPR